MNSIICVFGFYSVILAANVSSRDPRALRNENRPQPVILTPPFNFGYIIGDMLNMKVIFTNLSRDVVYTVYETDISHIIDQQKLNSHAGSDEITINNQIKNERIFVYVKLQVYAEWSKNITIFEGNAVDRVKGRYEYNDVCLRPYQTCTIKVDLKNEGTGNEYRPQPVILSSPFNFGYKSGAYFNGKLIFTNLSRDVVYTVYEADFSSSRKKQKLNSHAGSDEITVNKHIKNNRMLMYVQLKTNAEEACQNIAIFDGKAESRVYPGYDYNDTCLRYYQPCIIKVDLKNECTGSPTRTERPQVTVKPNTQATTTERRVTDSRNFNNSTIHLNDLTSPQYENKQPTTYKITTTDKIADVTDDPFQSTSQALPHENVETTTYKFTGSDNIISNNHPQPTNKLIYVIPSVIGMCVLILVIYIFIKKYFYQHSHPVETMDLNTYATAQEVVYADLSLTHGDNQPPRRYENSPYAKIIGVMKPVDKIVGKKKT